MPKTAKNWRSDSFRFPDDKRLRDAGVVLTQSAAIKYLDEYTARIGKDA